MHIVRYGWHPFAHWAADCLCSGIWLPVISVAVRADGLMAGWPRAGAAAQYSVLRDPALDVTPVLRRASASLRLKASGDSSLPSPVVIAKAQIKVAHQDE